MAQSSAHWSLCQNPLFDDKNELAGGTTTEGSDRHTPVPTATRDFTPTVVSVIALLVASGSANSSVVGYSEDDLQRIVKTILEARPFLPPASAPVPAPVIATALHYEGPCERLLKAWFPDVYRDKTYMECYNFF